MNVWRAGLALTLLLTTSAAEAIQVERHSRSGPDLFTAELQVAATTDEVLAALETPCAVRRWLPRTRDIGILHRDHQGLTRIRMVTDFPWPWQDRVAVLEFRRSHPQPDTILIRMRAVGQGETDEGLVRVTESGARWKILDTGQGTRIEYRQRFNPAGTVPQWLADSVAGTQVRHALENLRKLLEGGTAAEAHCRRRPAAGDHAGGGDPP